ncbi:AMP-dependent synthetase and ligase [Haloterrigena turkmenica DSM 5511]|uniref:AMP-dependent synthetase and ligase n=1 Tax=Haloterrigena turkmenica (strain ATCC 51198 / DSM 5511 / JCM 9101 / NCIMB 13204 / VKM B-1734 / 4k) TaxID=543526 RepID=D2RSW7_HALTV|nr:class I adenylate-forming enzyme family protein [Haloterrigena turkmenica]ADB58941.1 AMP-dependent synthetase and ligase [Haloterrigena turkmenica DSM 5511]
MAVPFVTLSLARRAERFPERTAVVDVSEERLYAPAETIHENRVSYGELSAMTTRTAEHLSALGIEAGDVVCLLTRNRVASLAFLFACRRLGATFFPVSHWLTPASVERPFDAIEPALVVSEAAQRDLVRSIPFDRSVTLEELAEADRDAVSDPDERDRESESDAPLLFLHGDDGRPIAGYSASALEWNCISVLVAWGLSSADVVPLTPPLSSPDGLVRVALSVLYVGGTLLLDRAFDPGDTLTAIAEENATLLAGRETAIRDLAAESGFDDAVDSLERVIVEGAAADDALEAYREQDISIARAEGRLECPTAFCQSFAADVGANHVGTPVPDCRARLVDESGTVLEGAAEGRLELSGPVVADGYVSAAGTDDENWYAPAEEQSNDYDESGDRGRFADNWFETDDRYRRDEDGTYRPQ